MSKGTGWKETYLNEAGIMENGSKEKEEIFLNKIAEQIKEEVMHFAVDNKKPMRGNHAKILAGFTNAQFKIAADIADDLRFGFLIPGQEYPAIVRFSNASGRVVNDDAHGDLRGAAIRIVTAQGNHDFLMTNAEQHHARTAWEAMVTIMSGVEKDIIMNNIPGNLPLEEEVAGLIGALPYLIKHLGLKTGWHIAQTLKKQMKRAVESLATETYWSRAPIAIGNVPDPEQSVALKYRLEPVMPKSVEPVEQNNLSHELEELVSKQETKFLFQVQRFINEIDTPIEDATIPWPAAFETIGELVIPQNSPMDNEAVDNLAFNPWNVDQASFLPIGSMNRSRKKLYPVSAGMGNRNNG